MYASSPSSVIFKTKNYSTWIFGLFIGSKNGSSSCRIELKRENIKITVKKKMQINSNK